MHFWVQSNMTVDMHLPGDIVHDLDPKISSGCVHSTSACMHTRKYLQIIADLEAAAKVSTPCQMLAYAVQIDGYLAYIKVRSTSFTVLL